MQDFLSSIATNDWLRAVGGLFALIILAWAANVVVRRVFLGLVHRVASRTQSTWDDHIIERRVFHRLANVAPALVTYAGIGLALGVAPDALAGGSAVDLQSTTWEALVLTGATLVRRVSLAWMVVALTTAAGGLLNALNDIYAETYAEAGNRPIKGYLQVISLFLYLAAGVVVISVLADRSPVVFLSGLGALTAVLMLVFRDTILSLVASVQIMSNDMIRIGDWVEMPQANTDGDVIDIALHTVKIQNWDKTISAIPTHKFISESFKNWRGMSESGGRRIKRTIHFDMSSIHFLSDEEVDQLSRFEFLHDYLQAKRTELEVANARKVAGNDVVPGPATPHERGHVPGLRAPLSTQPSQDPPGDDAHRAAAPAGAPGPAPGDLLFLQRHGLGQLRGNPGGHLRPPHREPPGVRPPGLPGAGGHRPEGVACPC